MIRDRALVLVATPHEAISADLDDALQREARRARDLLSGNDPQCRVAVRVPASGGEPADAYDLILERGLANGVMLVREKRRRSI